jgi:hypothetical protein
VVVGVALGVIGVRLVSHLLHHSGNRRNPSNFTFLNSCATRHTLPFNTTPATNGGCAKTVGMRLVSIDVCSVNTGWGEWIA